MTDSVPPHLELFEWALSELARPWVWAECEEATPNRVVLRTRATPGGATTITATFHLEPRAELNGDD